MHPIIFLIVSLFTTHSTFGQASENKLVITHLTKGFYIFKTFGGFKGSKVSANGMYLITKDGAIIFDTPWDTTQFQPLLDSIKARHNKNTILVVATHFHEDRTAGLEFYSHKGVKTFTSNKTDQLSTKNKMKRAEFLIQNDTIFNIGGYFFRTYFPGEGHAPDNIVIWFEKEKILYGGCLIKSIEDKSLGNLSDANVNAYAETIKNVIKFCKNPKFIITGHNNWNSTNSLRHTLRMAEDLKRKEKNS